MSQRKLAIIVGYGQSNEVGTGIAPRYSGGGSPYAPADVVTHAPIFSDSPNYYWTAGTPGNGIMCSIFQRLAEVIAIRTGWTVALKNMAVGGEGVTDNWSGWSGSAVYRPGDAGYDPASRVSGTVAQVAAWVARGYDVWMMTAGHQTDIANSRPVADIITANTDIQKACIAAGASKVFVGITPRYIGGAYETEFDPGGKFSLIQTGTIAAIGAKAFAGGNLSADTDAVKRMQGGGVNYLHINHVGVCWAAGVWRDALIAGGHI